MTRPKPNPKKQVSPIVAIVVIAAVMAIAGILMWRGLQPRRYSEAERMPPKAFLQMMNEAQGGGKKDRTGDPIRNRDNQPAQPTPASR